MQTTEFIISRVQSFEKKHSNQYEFNYGRHHIKQIEFTYSNSFYQQIIFGFAIVATIAAVNLDHAYKVVVKHEHYPSHHHESQADEWSSHGAGSYAHQDSSDDGSYKHQDSSDDGSYNHQDSSDDGSYKHQESSDNGAGYYGHEDHHEDFQHHPSYKFEYGVKDEKTGDHKSQWETRDGDVVKGEYTLEEADGTHRVVEYSSDKHNGFSAVVKKIGHAYHH